MTRAEKNVRLGVTLPLGPADEAVQFEAPISGLDPDFTYRIAEINLPVGDEQPRLLAGVTRQQSGAAWMESGISLVFNRRWDSAAVLLELETKEPS